MESGDDDVVSEDLSVETSSCIGKMSILNYMSTIGNYTGYPFSQEDIQTLLYGIASQRYGITSLHSFQIEAAENAIFGNNTLVIQPTGSGKSLCYQLVALQTKQVVLVFTPTIALMQDQVQQLRSNDIPAMVLGDGETMETLLSNDQPLVVYLTPEYIFGSSCTRRLSILKRLAENQRLALVAVDEAHLLFEWEHFR